MRAAIWKYGFGLTLAAFLFAGYASLAAERIPPSPRERILINDNWRFIKGDPSSNTVTLLYDVRPQWLKPSRSEAQTTASTEAGESIAPGKPAATSRVVLKPWILPTGNDFIKDPGRKFTRPSGNPGDGVAQAQLGFDDSSWREVNSPYDWAIDGPFTTQGGGGMGRLPSSGVGWYRKQLRIPAQDAGKSIFLDGDGAQRDPHEP